MQFSLVCIMCGFNSRENKVLPIDLQYNDCPTTVNNLIRLIKSLLIASFHKFDCNEEGGFTSYFGNKAFNDPIVPWCISAFPVFKIQTVD